jgi:hypothetical protein
VNDQVNRQHQGGLLTEIEQAALDEDVPVATALRRCLALGGRAHSPALRDWARRELNGYGPDDELPKYRLVPARLKIDAIVGYTQITGQSISPQQLPDFAREVVGADEHVPLRQGVAEIEKLAAEGTARGQPAQSPLPGAPMIGHAIDQRAGQPFQQTTNIYWEVAPTALYGVVDQVRTRLVDLVAELREVLPDDQDVPSQKQADQAVGVVIHGAPRSTYHLNTAQATGGSHSAVTAQHPRDAEDTLARKRRWGIIGGLIGGLVGIGSLIAGLGQWLGWRPPWP